VIVDGLQKIMPGMTVKPVEVQAKTHASSGNASTAPITGGNVGSDDT
jgi:hypothetical protein